MEALFQTVLGRGVAAGWLVLAVMVVRALLCRAPKNVRLLLWGFIALRLLLPITISSPFGLISSSQIQFQKALTVAQPAIDNGTPALNAAGHTVPADSIAPVPATTELLPPIWTTAGCAIWLVGVSGMLLYAAISTLRLRRRISGALPLRENILLCEGLATPFVLGLLHPKIFLPCGMDEETQMLVLSHEQGHIERRDHWAKPFGFLLLAIFWFQPLLWLGYALFCRDVELACDEHVLRTLGQQVKKAYASALVSFGEGKRFSAFPATFGGSGIKGRVKNTLRFHPVSRWCLSALAPLFLLLGVLFLTEREAPLLHDLNRNAKLNEHGESLVIAFEKSLFLNHNGSVFPSGNAEKNSAELGYRLVPRRDGYDVYLDLDIHELD